MMISNSQGVSNGNSFSAANGHSAASYDPADVRDAMPAPLLGHWLSPMQIRS